MAGEDDEKIEIDVGATTEVLSAIGRLMDLTQAHPEGLIAREVTRLGTLRPFLCVRRKSLEDILQQMKRDLER